LTVFIINLFWPGLGTCIAGVWAKEETSCMGCGMLQMFLSIFIAGWIWSIISGVRIMEKAKSNQSATSESQASTLKQNVSDKLPNMNHMIWWAEMSAQNIKQENKNAVKR